MSDNFKYVQAQPFSLAGSGAIVGATTVTFKSFTTIGGTPLTMSMFGNIGFMTLEPGNGTNEEQICFTGIVQNANGTGTITGVKSVLFISPYTQTSGLSITHAGSTTAIISNTSGFYDELTSKNDDETITGIWTFTNPNYPRMDTATPPPTDDVQLVTKKYVDDQVVAGAPDASTTTKGITKLSVAPVSPTNPIAVGTNDNRVSPVSLAALTAGEVAALAGTSGTPSTTNKYETENDTSNAASLTATTISFTASTKTIADSGSGFVTANFRPGDSIIVTGTASNNGTYTVVSVAAGAIVVVETLVNESAGSSFTLTTVTINKLVRYSSSSQAKVPLTPVASNDAASKSYTDIQDATRGQWVKISTITLSSVSVPDSTFTQVGQFTGLDGNTDGQYLINLELAATGGNSSGFTIRFDSDSGSDYTYLIGILGGAYSSLNSSGSQTQMQINGSTSSVIHGTIGINSSITYLGSNIQVSLNTSDNGAASVGWGQWVPSGNITSIQFNYEQTSGSTQTVSGVATIYKIDR